MNATGTALVFSTLIDIASTGYDLALNNTDEIFVVGDTGNTTGPVNSCSYDSTANGGSDMFFCKINAAGSKLLYYTYVGGCESDYANGHYRGFGDVGIVLTGPCLDEIYCGITTHSLNSITSF